MTTLSKLIVPLIITVAAFVILFNDNDYFTCFINGAKEGINLSFTLIPSLIILLTAVSMFNQSGALELLCNCFGNLFSKVKIPKEMLPIIITRPISASASTAMITSLFSNYGADSFVSRASSIMLGSSDTIIYTFSMYFSSCGIKKTRHAMLCALLTELFCIIMSCLITKLYFN